MSRALKASTALTDAPPTPLFNDLEMMEVEPHISNEERTVPNQDVNPSSSLVSPITTSTALTDAPTPLFNDLEVMEVERHISNEERNIPNQDVSPLSSLVSLIAHPSTANALEKTSDKYANKDTDSPLSHTKTVLTDVTNDPSMADRTAEVPPTRSPPRLSRKDGSPSVSLVPLSFSENTLPVMSLPAADASAMNTDVALPSLPSRPKPHPAYMSAAAIKAVVATEAFSSTTIPAPVLNIPVPSPSVDLPTPRVTSLNAIGEVPPAIVNEEQGGRRRRKLTVLGIQHAKEIEEKNEKAAARKKKDEEAARKKGDKARTTGGGASGRGRAIRGCKGSGRKASA